MAEAVVATLIFAITLVVIRWLFVPPRSDDWDWEIPLNPPLVDGERVNGPVMGRKRGGRWEYRRMTDDEMRQYLYADAW